MSIFTTIRRALQGSRKKVQATEGSRTTQDVLTPPVLSSGDKNIRKNNFRNYSSQMDQIYNGFIGWSEYGGDLIRPAIDIRTALVAGDSLSVNSENNKTRKFIDKLVKDSKFYGSQFIRGVEISEKEGKCLIVIEKQKDKIVWKPISWYLKKYTVKEDDKGNIIGVSFGDDGVDIEKIDLKPESFVYITTGAQTSNINTPVPRVSNVLTQIENYDRALYDLRETNHYWGRITPYFKTEDSKTARDILEAINAANWTIGKSMAAAADMSLLGPGNQAADPLTREMSLNLKIISTCLGIPVHWFGWTDLMSNRALAEELTNLISIGTKKERLIWNEGVVELIQKSMVIAVDNGIEGSINDPDGFQVDIPFINKEKLKDIIEVWLPMRDTGHISEATLLNKIPGINPAQEMNQIAEEEKKESENRTPLEITEESRFTEEAV